MKPEEILEELARAECVLTGQHFVYTGGKHGPAYVNMRGVAHNVDFISRVGAEQASQLEPYEPDVIIGPETLGRTLTDFVAERISMRGLSVTMVWCDMDDVEDKEGNKTGEKVASFSPKFNFVDVIRGKRVAIIDDLLTTGSSIRAVAKLVAECGGEAVVAAVVVRRSPEVGATECDVPALEVLAEVEGFATFTEEECAKSGPCSKQVPMVLRPGHGYKWIENHPDYPIA